MVIGSELRGDLNLNPSYRPWERGDLLRRLSTFKLAGKLPKVRLFPRFYRVLCGG